MNLLSILAFSLMFALSCNSSDFSGASKSSAPAKKKPIGKTSEPKEDKEKLKDKDDDDKDNDDEDKNDFDSENSKEEEPDIDEAVKVDCEKDEEKIDAAGSPFSFTDEGQLRDFVNGRCKTGISANFHGAGAVGSDQVTATAVCNLKGYKTAVVAATSRYSSPGDNFIAFWDEAQKKFLLVNARDRNSKAKTLNCSEKLKSECHDENKKIDCVF
jgi:hypothetical protein